MLIIPEIKTVVILIPRTGTRSLKAAVAAAYPRSMLLYRHMEADGIPTGYDRWRRITLVRNPLDRLWSLYKFLRDIQQEPNWTPGYADRMRATVQMPFSDWLLNNETPFTNPYRGNGEMVYYPVYAVKHNLPENRKSQFLYARPDLGVECFPEGERIKMYEQLRLDHVEHLHATSDVSPPILTRGAWEYLDRTFGWDFVASRDGAHWC